MSKVMGRRNIVEKKCFRFKFVCFDEALIIEKDKNYIKFDLLNLLVR